MFRLYSISDPNVRVEVDEDDLRKMLGRGWAPSVTTVLEVFRPFALVAWREKEIAQRAHSYAIEHGLLIEDAVKEVRKELNKEGVEATRIGTWLHEELTKHFLCRESALPSELLESFTAEPLLSGTSTPEDRIVSYRFVEFLHGLPFGGEIDLILRGKAVIDWKFQRKSDAVVHDDWAVQLAAYALACPMSNKVLANAIFLGSTRDDIKYYGLEVWSSHSLIRALEEFERRLKSFYWRYGCP